MKSILEDDFSISGEELSNAAEGILEFLDKNHVNITGDLEKLVGTPGIGGKISVKSEKVNEIMTKRTLSYADQKKGYILKIEMNPEGYFTFTARVNIPLQHYKPSEKDSWGNIPQCRKIYHVLNMNPLVPIRNDLLDMSHHQ